MKRIDEYPTSEKDGVKYCVGRPLPFGATVVGDDAVNFSIYSKDADYCELLLYHLGERDPFFSIPLENELHFGSVFSIMIFGLDWEEIEYGYCFDGPHEWSQGYRFNREKIVLDPYAKLVSGRDRWFTRTYAKDELFQF